MSLAPSFRRLRGGVVQLVEPVAVAAPPIGGSYRPGARRGFEQPFRLPLSAVDRQLVAEARELGAGETLNLGNVLQVRQVLGWHIRAMHEPLAYDGLERGRSRHEAVLLRAALRTAERWAARSAVPHTGGRREMERRAAARLSC